MLMCRREQVNDSSADLDQLNASLIPKQEVYFETASVQLLGDGFEWRGETKLIHMIYTPVAS
jgi:hypothetical protein